LASSIFRKNLNQTHYETSFLTRMMVCRLVANFLAMAETLIPAARSSRDVHSAFDLSAGF
jgi:hypothetical protein